MELDHPDTAHNPLIESLDTWLAQLEAINSGVITRLVESAQAPDLLAVAYSSLNPDGPPASNGRTALRWALIADGADEETASTVDALYLECLISRPIAAR